MIIDMNSEGDIWRLFGGEDHTMPGKWQQSFETLKRQLYDHDGFHMHKPVVPRDGEVATAKKKIKLRFPFTDTSRRYRYLLIARGKQVCVDQSRLLPVGKAMRDPSLIVQYLGKVVQDDTPI